MAEVERLFAEFVEAHLGAGSRPVGVHRPRGGRRSPGAGGPDRRLLRGRAPEAVGRRGVQGSDAERLVDAIDRSLAGARGYGLRCGSATGRG